MSVSPLPAFTVATIGLIFASLLAGNALETSPIPTFKPLSTDCQVTVPVLGDVACAITRGVNLAINFFGTIINGIIHLANLMSFNITGAPWYARLAVATTIGGSLLVALIQILRGN